MSFGMIARMAKTLVAYGIAAGPSVPIHWKCVGCGWSKSAMPERADPTRVPAEVQKEYDAHRCEDFTTGKHQSALANFCAVDFPPKEDELLAHGEGHVYVICWKAEGRDVPFYVGQTERLKGRMCDYQSAQFAACTDFRVGEAIRYLKHEHGFRIVVLYKKSEDPRHDEYTLIRDLQLAGLRLLNSLPSYDYRRADKEEERQTVQRFCEILLANPPL